MIEDMKRQYLDLLVGIGFVKASERSCMAGSFQFCNVPTAYNVYAHSVPVVHGAIVAGLYPKLAVRDGLTFVNPSFSMQIHPSSVLHQTETLLPSDFIVYNTVVMTHETVYSWEAASIDAVAVMLLASDMEIKVTKRH